MDKFAFQFVKQFTDSYELRYINRAMYEDIEMSQDHAWRMFLYMAYRGDAEYCARFPGAIMRGYERMVSFIPHHGSIAMCRLICGSIPTIRWKVAHYAGVGNHRHIFEWLFNEYPDERSNLCTFFAGGAAAGGHMELCKYGITMLVDANSINHVLVSAVNSGRCDICEMIIEQGGNNYTAAALVAADSGQIAICGMFCKYLDIRTLRNLRNIGVSRKHDGIVSLADGWIARAAA